MARSTGYVLGMVGPVATADFAEYLEPRPGGTSTPPGLGGSPVGLLCRELLARAHRLIVFTVDPSVSTEVTLSGPHVKLCIGPYRAAPRARASDFFARERSYLRRAILRERPDVLHAQWTYEFALGALDSGLPHVVTAHDAPMAILRLHPHPYRAIRAAMAYRALSRARSVAAVSPYVAEHLRRWRFYPRPVSVVPNGLPESAFARPSERTRSMYDPVFATILMGWGGRKNGQAAIEAFGLVRRELPSARLKMFGVGHGPGEAAQSWASRRSLHGGIEFMGQVPYAELMRRLPEEVGVLVHPSLEESHGMVLIEAMAAGIPTIGGVRSGAVPWTLDQGKAGVLVDVTSPPAIAEAMLRLARQADVRRQIGASGAASVWHRFHIGRVADAYEELYRRALEGQSYPRTAIPQ